MYTRIYTCTHIHVHVHIQMYVQYMYLCFGPAAAVLKCKIFGDLLLWKNDICFDYSTTCAFVFSFSVL